MTSEMQAAAEGLRFEHAAQLRDQIHAAGQIVERQKIVSTKAEDQDVIAFAQDARTGETCAQVFFIRRGRLIGRESFVLDGTSTEQQGELVAAFVKQFYSEAAYVPDRILLPQSIEERQIIEQWLRSKRGGRKVTLLAPKQGAKRQLVEMAAENAAAMLTTLQAQWQADTNRQTEGLTQLQEALGLSEPPSRIECFDISTLQGTNTVASMVVFAKGAPYKREVLRRRFRRAVETAVPDPGRKARKSDAAWKILPDLLIVDGGKGQLGVAVDVLAEFELTEVVPVAGLAKQREELFLPGRPDSILLPPGSQGLFLVQRVRDEAHRFAITFHREQRGKAAVASQLDAIPGIGPVRRKALLSRFGSIDAIRGASMEELAAVPGMSAAAARQVRENL
jgi:excinuclease ABC subunit C